MCVLLIFSCILYIPQLIALPELPCQLETGSKTDITVLSHYAEEDSELCALGLSETDYHQRRSCWSCQHERCSSKHQH